MANLSLHRYGDVPSTTTRLDYWKVGIERYYNTPPALQRTNTEISKQIFPVKELGSHSPNFHIHVAVSNFIHSHNRSVYSAAGHMRTDPGNL
jgi:hypothetical protein